MVTSPLRFLLPAVLAAPLSLFAAGEIDPTFAPVPGITAEAGIAADGKVLGLGDYDGSEDGAGVTLVRFAADGSVDPTFTAPFREFVSAFRHFEVQADGKLMVGGGILNGESTSGILNRLQPDGTIDPGFKLTAGVSAATQLVVQKDGKVIVNGQNTSEPTLRSVFSRVNADGTLDKSYDLPDTLLSSIPTDFALQPDGKLVIIGNFADIQGATFATFSTARLSTSGAYDSGFDQAPAPDPSKSLTEELAIQKDGKLIVSGGTYSPFPTVSAFLIRYNADGSLDGSFAPTIGPAAGADSLTTHVAAILVQNDGKIVIGGVFGMVNGTPRTNIARLNPDGSLDATFNSPAEFQTRVQAQVIDIKEAGDGKLIVAGELYAVATTPGSSATTVYGLVRLMNDDTPGTTNPPPVTKGPDLNASVTGVKVKAKADKTTIKTTLFVRNKGKKKAKGVEAAAYLSADATFGATTDEFLGMVDLGDSSNLDKKASSPAIPVKVKLPGGTVVTGKYLLVVIDPTDQIEETDETNNVASVGPLP